MSSALEELKDRLSELEVDLGFIFAASRLRPRLGDMLDWSAGQDVTSLAQAFMDAKGARLEGILGPLLLRMLAAFERYLRRLIEEALVFHLNRTENYDEVSAHIKTRNLVLTGNLLAIIESPPNHIDIQVSSLVKNLATCEPGAKEFQFNTKAFAATVVGMGPSAVEKALGNLGIKDWWDDLGSNQKLADAISTTGARATGKRARSRLDELWRWRNNLAHGGDEEIALTETEILDCLNFVQIFSAALDEVVLESFK